MPKLVLAIGITAAVTVLSYHAIPPVLTIALTAPEIIAEGMDLPNANP